MVDVNVSAVLKAAAVPMSHTATGILKVEIMGSLLLIGWIIATIGFYRWYKMEYHDYKLKREKEALVEKNIPFNEEDYNPPLRSHIINYLFFFGGIVIALCGVLTWFIIPA
jgi:hypothetical protein